MHTYSVGQPYVPGRESWPEAVEYNYRGGQHELRAFLPNPSDAEIAAFSTGELQFAVAPHQGIVFLLYRVGDVIPWSDCPFDIHRVPQAERVLPPVEVPAPAARPLLHILLVDAATGLIRALRVVGLPPLFAATLQGAIHAQASMRPDPKRFDRELAKVYALHTSEELVTYAAWVRCLVPGDGGEPIDIRLDGSRPPYADPGV